MEMIKEYIKPELLILIPVLYVIGMGFKKTTLLKDKFIPVVLGIISILLSAIYLMATSEMDSFKEVMMALFTCATQGVLIAGCSVYFNQIYKQLQK